MSESFAYTQPARVLIAVLSIAGVGSFSFWFPDVESAIEKLGIFCFILSFVWAALYVRSFEILVSEKSITRKSLFSNVEIAWLEVDDLILWPKATEVRSSTGSRRIRVNHPDSNNPVEKLDGVGEHERLKELIISYALPILTPIWKEKTKARKYKYPSPPVWSYLATSVPLIYWIPMTIAFPPFENPGYFLAGLPFLAASVYLAYRLGLISRRKVLWLDERGLILKNGAKIVIPWTAVLRVSGGEPLTTEGLKIDSTVGRSIFVPKGVNRFSDLAYQISQYVPAEKFQANLLFPNS